jgi:hypothetical protein
MTTEEVVRHLAEHIEPHVSKSQAAKILWISLANCPLARTFDSLTPYTAEEQH